MQTIEYFMIPSSPWTYLGHARLGEIAAANNAKIELKPFDLGQVFPVSGGLPLGKRAPQRQVYRLAELARWRDFLQLPLTVEPKFFPTPADAAMQLIVAANQLSGDAAAFALAGAIMKALWAEETDIADAQSLRAIATAQGLDYDQLIKAAPAAVETIAANTREAIDTQVFGSPWFRINGQNFWGQDRLDFVERALRI
ncbi:MAG: 2-hydroxychromene-2-carboxylate isomerase [Burkholderiaceae bacterium]